LGDIGDMTQINAEYQSRSPIPCSVEVRANNEVADGGGVNVRRER